jgi:hypothetical protein
VVCPGNSDLGDIINAHFEFEAAKAHLSNLLAKSGDEYTIRTALGITSL